MGVEPPTPLPSPTFSSASGKPNSKVGIFLAFSGRTTGGSHTATSCRMGEAVGAIRGWGRRAGTPASPPCTPSPEATRCRAGGIFQPADRKPSLLCEMTCCVVLRVLSVVLTSLSVRLGLVDPDLPPPGPPTLKSFKVNAALLLALLETPNYL